MNGSKTISKIILLVILISILFPLTSAISSNKVPDPPYLEIKDIKYENMEINATIYSRVSFRTVNVHFSRSRIVGDTIKEPVLINIAHIRTEKFETRYVTMPWVDCGHFMIIVEIPGYAQASKEVWVPKSKTSLFNTPFLDNLFQYPIFTKVLFFKILNLI